VGAAVCLVMNEPVYTLACVTLSTICMIGSQIAETVVEIRVHQLIESARQETK
jgi:hypothetical protein